MTPRTEPQRLKPEATATTAEPRPTIKRPNRKLRYCGGAKDHAPAKRQRPELGGGKQGGGEGGGDEAAFIEIGDGLCATPGCTLPDFHAGPCQTHLVVGPRQRREPERWTAEEGATRRVASAARCPTADNVVAVLQTDGAEAGWWQEDAAEEPSVAEGGTPLEAPVAVAEVRARLCATPGCTLPDFHPGPCQTHLVVGPRQRREPERWTAEGIASAARCPTADDVVAVLETDGAEASWWQGPVLEDVVVEPGATERAGEPRRTGRAPKAVQRFVAEPAKREQLPKDEEDEDSDVGVEGEESEGTPLGAAPAAAAAVRTPATRAVLPLRSIRLGGRSFFPGDTVLVLPPEGAKLPSGAKHWVLLLDALWRAADGAEFCEGRWYYYPEETEAGRLPGHDEREVFLSAHPSGPQGVEVIDGPCDVLEWARYEEQRVERAPRMPLKRSRAWWLQERRPLLRTLERRLRSPDSAVIETKRGREGDLAWPPPWRGEEPLPPSSNRRSGSTALGMSTTTSEPSRAATRTTRAPPSSAR
jgi:hypothetical protein